MSILKMPLEILENRGSDSFKSHLDLSELESRTKKYREKWRDEIIDCSNGLVFSFTNEQKVKYKGEDGNDYIADISADAFGQLCSRIGEGGLGKYIVACLNNKKINPQLAFDNFSEWANLFHGKLLFRISDGVIRAVLSDSYRPFDSTQVIKTLRQTVDTDEYALASTYISEDRTHLRFISKEPLKATFDRSPLYSGFAINSSDVGKASLSMQYFVWRQVCSNGMLAVKNGGTLFKQYHIGEEMTNSKIAEFNVAMLNAHRLDDRYLEVSEMASDKFLKDYEFKNYLDFIKSKGKLSDKALEELTNTIDHSYNHTVWGVLNGVTEHAQKYSLDNRIALEELAAERLMSFRG